MDLIHSMCLPQYKGWIVRSDQKARVATEEGREREKEREREWTRWNLVNGVAFKKAG